MLRAVAPEGVVASDDAAVIEAVAYLRAKGFEPHVVDALAAEVKQLCWTGSWTMVDGRRRRVLPFLQSSRGREPTAAAELSSGPPKSASESVRQTFLIRHRPDIST